MSFWKQSRIRAGENSQKDYHPLPTPKSHKLMERRWEGTHMQLRRSLTITQVEKVEIKVRKNKSYTFF